MTDTSFKSNPGGFKQDQEKVDGDHLISKISIALQVLTIASDWLCSRNIANVCQHVGVPGDNSCSVWISCNMTNMNVTNHKCSWWSEGLTSIYCYYTLSEKFAKRRDIQECNMITFFHYVNLPLSTHRFFKLRSPLFHTTMKYKGNL